MSLGLFIFLIVFVAAGIVIYRFFRNTEAENSAENNSLENDSNFDEEFFKRTQAGETYQLFLSISSQRDCAIIRSLLAADNIPTYVEGEHMNNIYGGIAGTMNAVVAIKLYVLSSDYDKAFDISKDFVEKKVEKLKNEDSKSAEKVMAGLAAVLMTPGAFVSSQEFLGITFWPKQDSVNQD